MGSVVVQLVHEGVRDEVEDGVTQQTSNGQGDEKLDGKGKGIWRYSGQYALYCTVALSNHLTHNQLILPEFQKFESETLKLELVEFQRVFLPSLSGLRSLTFDTAGSSKFMVFEAQYYSYFR